MTLLGTVGFTFLSLCLGFFGFLMAAFGGGGAVNSLELSKMNLLALDLAIYLLPASSVVATAGLWYAYYHESAPIYYTWASLPLIALLAYFAFLYFVVGFR